MDTPANDGRPRGGTPTDHNVAGELCSVELQTLSRWQLAALAEECFAELLRVSVNATPDYRAAVIDGISGAQKVRAWWD